LARTPSLALKPYITRYYHRLIANLNISDNVTDLMLYPTKSDKREIGILFFICQVIIKLEDESNFLAMID